MHHGAFVLIQKYAAFGSISRNSAISFWEFSELGKLTIRTSICTIHTGLVQVTAAHQEEIFFPSVTTSSTSHKRGRFWVPFR